MSVNLIQDLLVRFKKVDNFQDLAALLSDVKEFFNQTAKNNIVFSQEIPEILKDLPLVDKSDVKIPASIQEIDLIEPTEANDTLANEFRRIDLNRVEHKQQLVDFSPKLDVLSMDDLTNKLQLTTHLTIMQPIQTSSIVNPVTVHAVNNAPNTRPVYVHQNDEGNDTSIVELDVDIYDGIQNLFAENQNDIPVSQEPEIDMDSLLDGLEVVIENPSPVIAKQAVLPEPSTLLLNTFKKAVTDVMNAVNNLVGVTKIAKTQEETKIQEAAEQAKALEAAKVATEQAKALEEVKVAEQAKMNALIEALEVDAKALEEAKVAAEKAAAELKAKALEETKALEVAKAAAEIAKMEARMDALEAQAKALEEAKIADQAKKALDMNALIDSLDVGSTIAVDQDIMNAIIDSLETSQEPAIVMPPPPPPPPPSKASDKKAKTWAKIETTNDDSSKEAIKAVEAHPSENKFLDEIRAQQQAHAAKVSDKSIEASISEKKQSHESDYVLLNALSKAMGFGAAVAQAIVGAQEESDFDKEEKELEHIRKNEKIIDDAFEAKLFQSNNHEVLHEQYMAKIQELKPLIDTLITQYHTKLFNGINKLSLDAQKLVHDKMDNPEKVESFVKNQLLTHATDIAVKLSVDAFEQMKSKFDLKGSIELSEVDVAIDELLKSKTLLATIDEAVSKELTAILQEETKYLSNASGRDHKAHLDAAVDSLSKLFDADKTIVDKMIQVHKPVSHVEVSDTKSDIASEKFDLVKQIEARRLALSGHSAMNKLIDDLDVTDSSVVKKPVVLSEVVSKDDSIPGLDGVGSTKTASAIVDTSPVGAVDTNVGPMPVIPNVMPQVEAHVEQHFG